MKKDFSYWFELLSQPVTMFLCGALLMSKPDGIAGLVTKALSIALFLFGLFLCLKGFSRRDAAKIIFGLVLVAIGSKLLRNPMALARFCGVILGINTVSEYLANRSFSRPLPIFTAVLALVLIFAPLSLTRLVFSTCGLVLMAVAVILLIYRLKNQESQQNSNIIDAL